MKATWIIPIVLSLIIMGCGQTAEQTPVQTPPPLETGEPVLVEITSDGFKPETVSVAAGETVTWSNKDTIAHWPASAIHPTHTAYPTNGGCIGSTFDACQELEEGESWSFTFTEKGTWKYHDHLNPSLKGTVVVE